VGKPSRRKIRPIGETVGLTPITDLSVFGVVFTCEGSCASFKHMKLRVWESVFLQVALKVREEMGQ
jgi:hypothetical protein